jgi:hypothetical protein
MLRKRWADQQLVEEIALGMAAADPTDGVPNQEQFFDDPRGIPAAMGEYRPAQRQPGFACDGWRSSAGINFRIARSPVPPNTTMSKGATGSSRLASGRVIVIL